MQQAKEFIHKDDRVLDAILNARQYTLRQSKNPRHQRFGESLSYEGFLKKYFYWNEARMALQKLDGQAFHEFWSGLLEMNETSPLLFKKWLLDHDGYGDPEVLMKTANEGAYERTMRGFNKLKEKNGRLTRAFESISNELSEADVDATADIIRSHKP